MLKAHIEKEKSLKCLYFNAWETDFSDNPLVSLLGEMELSIAGNPSNKKTFKTQLNKAKQYASSIGKRGLPLLVRVMTNGLLNIDAATEKLISEFAANSVEGYIEEKSLNKKFREALQKAVQGLIKSEDKKNLIVFIDELDRCRPTYAIELLERMKHFFNTENIIFVLALDMQQLGVSLGAVYGEDIKDKEYLRRFIDLEYLLPIPDAEKFTDNLFERFEFGDFFSKRTHQVLVYDKRHLRETFNQLFNIFDLSLRAREQCFTRLRVLISVTDQTQYIYPELLAMLIVLKEVKPAFYQEYAFKGSSAMAILNFLNETNRGAKFLTTDEGIFLETMLIAAESPQNLDSAEIQGYRGTAEDPSANEVDKKRAVKFMENISWMRQKRIWPSLPHILGKIEIAANMK